MGGNDKECRKINKKLWQFSNQKLHNLGVGQNLMKFAVEDLLMVFVATSPYPSVMADSKSI